MAADSDKPTVDEGGTDGIDAAAVELKPNPAPHTKPTTITLRLNMIAPIVAEPGSNYGMATIVMQITVN